MKHLLLILTFVAACAGSVFAADSIQISATKKTASERKSEKQDLARGSTYLKQSTEFYEFTLRNMNPNIPSPVEVSWVVMMEGAGGRLHVGTQGHKQVALPFGRPLMVETDPVKLEERVIDRDKGRGSLEQKIVGYGIRVKDESGNLLAEKFSSKSIQQEVEVLQASGDQKRNKQAEREPKRLKKRVKHGKP